VSGLVSVRMTDQGMAWRMQASNRFSIYLKWRDMTRVGMMGHIVAMREKRLKSPSSGRKITSEWPVIRPARASRNGYISDARPLSFVALTGISAQV